MSLSTLEIENLVTDALVKQEKIDIYNVNLSVAITDVSNATNIPEQELLAIYGKETKEKYG